MNITDIKLSLLAVAGSEVVYLMEIGDWKEYVEGKPTGKTLGTRYTVACPKQDFEKFTVKIRNHPIMSNNELKELKANGQVQVTFTDFEAHVYKDKSGNFSIYAEANGIEMIS